MTIQEYTEAIVPIILLCRKEKVLNPTSYRRSHLWYLYREAFYGFSEFSDWKAKYRESFKANEMSKQLRPPVTLLNQTWYDQNNFDTGRLNGKFHLEHIYTGNMFRDAIDALSDNELTAKKVVDIIKKNYQLAWILKVEDRQLSKKKRGENILDALNFYKSKKIDLL